MHDHGYGPIRLLVGGTPTPSHESDRPRLRTTEHKALGQRRPPDIGQMTESPRKACRIALS